MDNDAKNISVVRELNRLIRENPDQNGLMYDFMSKLRDRVICLQGTEFSTTGLPVQEAIKFLQRIKAKTNGYQT